MEINKFENFKDDGKIIYKPTRIFLLYDFEKRNKYYETCGFKFSDFGQFERKIQKEEISLSIQCSKDEKCFCIAFHEDFKKEKIKYIGSITQKGKKEYTGKRFTKKFIEIKYSEMKNFYKILMNSFKKSEFNSNAFIKIK